MNARLKNFFSFSNNNNNNSNNNNRNHSRYKSNPNLRGQAYENAVASNPPVRGSYPVAGNGPNVLEQMQLSRAKRDQRDTRRQTVRPAPVKVVTADNDPYEVPPMLVAEAPDVPRRRRDAYNARPSTAPEEEHIGDGDPPTSGSTMGRTQSVFSMRSLPSSFFSNEKRDSIRSNLDSPPLPPLPPSSPTISLGPKRASKYPPYTAAPSNRSSRRFSQHVDLLDAYSDITQSSEVSKQKVKASGLRNYGEDVADRNMITHGDKFDREARSASTRQDRSYVYLTNPLRRGAADGDKHHHYHQPLASPPPAALSRLQHHDGNGNGDDTIVSPRNADLHPHISIIGSNAVFPARVSSMQHSPRPARDADRPDEGGRPVTSSSIPHDHAHNPPPKDLRRHTLPTQHVLSSPTTLDKGRAPAKTPPVESYRPAPPPANHTPPPPPKHQHLSTVGSREELPSRTRRPQSGSKQHIDDIASERARRQNRSVSYSAFPNTSTEGYPRSRHTSLSSMASQSHPPGTRTAMDAHTVSPPSMAEGLAETKNGFNPKHSTDVEIVKRTAPGVVHEHITPTQHEIREEQVTREIHTHDVIHRIQPIIEVEVLPAKHYLSTTNGDGREVLVQVPESRLPGRVGNGSPGMNWEIKQTSLQRRDQSDSPHHIRNASLGRLIQGEEMGGAEAPIIGLARGEPPMTRQRSRTWSRTRNQSPVKLANTSSAMPNNNRQGNSTNDTVQGYENAAHHPNRMESHQGPRYIGPGIGDLSGTQYGDRHSSDEEQRVKVPEPTRSEEELLFRDSGYGSGGMLPGLTAKAPMAKEAMGLGLGNEDSGDGLSADTSRSTHVSRQAESPVGEGTRALRRMKGRSSSVGHVKFADDGEEGEGGLQSVVGGMQKLDMED